MNKRCRKCGVQYPATAEHWYRVGSSWSARCKHCISDDKRASYRGSALVLRVSAECKERARRAIEEFKQELRQE